MWYHMDGCAKQYCCASAMYILTCLALYFMIMIDRYVGSPGHVKDFVYVLNARDKRMLKL